MLQHSLVHLLYCVIKHSLHFLRAGEEKQPPSSKIQVRTSELDCWNNYFFYPNCPRLEFWVRLSVSKLHSVLPCTYAAVTSSLLTYFAPSPFPITIHDTQSSFIMMLFSSFLSQTWEGVAAIFLIYSNNSSYAAPMKCAPLSGIP